MELEIAKITCMVHGSLFKGLLEELHQAGIYDIYNYSGRMAVLEDPRGLAVLLRSAGLASEPVEILRFFVPIAAEEQAIAMVAKRCRLNIPGRGTVYSERLKLSQCHPGISLNQNLDLSQYHPAGFQIFRQLMGITCIVQRGEADDVVRMLLHLGVVPTVMHGAGTGIRDRLGLLRITLPKEKDLILMVVGPTEADFITEKIIRVGRLERPGRGFIYQTPVSCGMINFKSSNRQVGHAASIDQIIAAIDALKGDFSWRQGATGIDQQVKRSYMTGIEVSAFMNEGYSAALAREVMRLGVTGATVLSPKLIRPSLQSDQRVLPAREVVRMMIPAERLQGVIDICRELDICGEGGESFIVVGDVPRAFTYQAKEKKSTNQRLAAKEHLK
ncbi:MAG: hypothetical protein ACOH5I_10465 [Oligoflexus sp.]